MVCHSILTSPPRLLHRGIIITALVIGACKTDTPVDPQPRSRIPDDLAAVTFMAEGRPSLPYAILELVQPGGFNGFVLVSGSGIPVWFFRTTGTPFGFTMRHNGNFVFLDSNLGLLEVTLSGLVVRSLDQEQPPGRYIHHDLVATHHNTILFIANDWQTWRDTLISGEAIWEWDPERGIAEKRWSSFDHFDPAVDRGPRYRTNDWLHANSISIGRQHNIILSLHFLDQVISISPDYSQIQWRLGGVRATHPVDDPFSGQHTASEVSSGRTLIFDNGFERAGVGFSRAVEYEIQAASARKVWEWRPDRTNWARIISSARRLPNGNTFVAFGVSEGIPPGSTGPIEVYEVTASGQVVWHLEISGGARTMYRATPLAF